MLELQLEYKFPTNKVVYLTPVARLKGAATTLNHETATVISGTFKGYNLPVLAETGNYLKVFSDEQRFAIEEYLGLEKNTMKFTSDRPGNCTYWNKKTVNIGKEGKKFDLSDVGQYIEYAICVAQTNIAKTFDEIKAKKAEYDFYFLDREEKAKSENVSLEQKGQAFAKAIELSKSLIKMTKFIKVYQGTAAPKDWQADTYKNALLNAAETNPKKFLAVTDNPDYEYELLLIEAIQTKNIIHEGKGYRLGWSEVRDYIATNKPDVIAWLKNPLNNKLKIEIATKTAEALGETSKD